ncbi:MAG TPA: VOC family protein [Anaerolineaceae bacterium]|nr:VOC family protein [Anaerolineaceae bacterium]
MSVFVSHIALFVPDLQEAERFYKHLFDMELIGREIENEEGMGYTLPFDKSWEDVKAAGVDLHMLALRMGSFVLAMFKGAQAPGQVYVIGLGMTEEDIKAIHSRIQDGNFATQFRPDYLEFVDPYQITWQIAVNPIFRTSGDFAGRWIEI